MRHSTRHPGGHKWPAGLVVVPFLALALGGVLGGAAVAGNPHAKPPTTTTTATTTATGVKPSSTTKHHTTANAGSNDTKKYGNGKTAGQIAIKHGASTTTPVHGPGNSQPHKVAACPKKKGKTHEVDVHALKNHPASCTGGSTSTTATTTTTHTTHTHTTPTGTTPSTTTPASHTAGQTAAPANVSGTAAATRTLKRKASGTSGALSTARSSGVRAKTKTLKARAHRTNRTAIATARAARAVKGRAHFTG